PYEQLIQQEVFEPLGMEAAGFGTPLQRGPNQPNGHRADGTPSAPEADNPEAITPAGRVHCTMQDWSRFVAAHLIGPRGEHDLLKPSTFTELHAPAPGADRSYAMGWGTGSRDWAGGKVLTHAGSNTMWYCVAWVAPEKNMAVLVACNQGGDVAAKACDQAATLAIGLQQKRLSEPRKRWNWNDTSDRVWIGPDFWANRLQDWRVHDGRVECIERRPKMSQRTCHVLPWSIDCPNDKRSTVTRGYERIGDGVRLSVETGAMDMNGEPDPNAWSGLLLGAGGQHVDHRLTAQVHHVPAEDGGLLCLVDETGRVSLRHNDQPLATQSSWAIARFVGAEQLPTFEAAQAHDETVTLDGPFEGTLEVIV
ncbi:MAG: beta-lactamase family protein, partial [Phycisphaerales bacterium]|nr:beta-lactamase family protein [Phycisphaerales bacterium]